MSKNVEEKVEKFKREMLTAALIQCSEKQQELFRMMYPNGVPTRRLESAIDLCERTIKQNVKRKRGGEQIAE